MEKRKQEEELKRVREMEERFQRVKASVISSLCELFHASNKNKYPLTSECWLDVSVRSLCTASVDENSIIW